MKKNKISKNTVDKAKAIIIVDDPDFGPSILLSQETKEKGKLGLFGGTNKNKESIEKTLKRELKEELGDTIKVVLLEKVAKQFLPYKAKHGLVNYHSYIVKVKGSISCKDPEISGFGLYPLSSDKLHKSYRKKAVKDFEMQNFAQQIIKFFREHYKEEGLEKYISDVNLGPKGKKSVKKYKEEILKNL